ncbi:MAG: DUF1559 domain-containing protein [Planctomycetaceae bacterium]|jgi:prepilin-type N-terminal cleavage/methylation domain-containing protein/prepilin-type processing-associated H-X9-DG protein|nr:DUF1559 domain-containing protein [Planctomycetaceae bacterium]
MKNLTKNFASNSTDNFMLEWEKAGEGGYFYKELNVNKEPPIDKQNFPTFFSVFTLTRSSPFGFTLVELLVVIAIIGVLIALLLPAVQAAREAANRMSCTSNQKNIALAMQNYHDVYSVFPYGGIPYREHEFDGGAGGFSYDSHSWVSRFLPFIEQAPLFQNLDFTLRVGNAGGDGHYQFRRAILDFMKCPSDKRVVAEPGNYEWGISRDNYVVNMGRTDLGGYNGGTDSIITNTDYLNNGAPFSIGRFENPSAPSGFKPIQTGMNDAGDGTSNTLMVSEVVVPKDTGYQGYVGIPRYAGGAGFTTWFPPNGTGDYLARKCYIQDDPASCTQTWTDHRHVPFSIITARSNHSGGVNAALIDGSVRFFPSSINIDTWRALSTTQGGESVSP